MTRDKNLILIALPIPSSGAMRWQTFYALARLQVSPELRAYQLMIVPFGGCDVCHARNLAFHFWRTKTQCGRMLFIDSDLNFTAASIAALLQWDVPVISGLYPLDDTFLRWSYQGWRRQDPMYKELWTVEEICTGLLCLRFDVLEKLLRKEDEFVIEDAEYRGEVGYEVTKMGVYDRRRYSEDFYLSKIMRAAGFAIRVDPSVIADHIKTVGILKSFGRGEIEQSLKMASQEFRQALAVD